jgi:SAM-dependent methyltransferase
LEYVNPFSDIDWKSEDSEIILKRLGTTGADIMYGRIAAQVLKDTGKFSGICIDLGGGHGKLSEYLVENSKLTSYVVDINSFQLNYLNSISKNGRYNGRIIPVFAYAESLPFQDNFADLIVSRGSCMFWNDEKSAISEIMRVLKPDGVAYIGGGIGRGVTREEFEKIRDEIYKPLQEEEGIDEGTPFVMLESIYTPEFFNKWITIFENLKISTYSVIKDNGVFFKLEKKWTPVSSEIYG